MTTNLLATLTVLLFTNTVTHWPQKQEGTTHSTYYDSWAATKHLHPYTLEYVAPEVPNWIDDTNADTRSVETTVTRYRLLSATNAAYVPPAAYHLVGGLAYFTNEIFTATNASIAWHYEVDERRVRTNSWEWLKMSEDGTFHPPPGARIRRARATLLWPDMFPQVEIETNYWLATATNQYDASGNMFLGNLPNIGPTITCPITLAVWATNAQPTWLEQSTNSAEEAILDKLESWIKDIRHTASPKQKP